MKKLLIASNMLLLGIIVFLGCNSNGQNRPSAINRQQQVDTCMRRFCKPYKPEDLTGVLRANIIQQLSLAYANDRGKAYINEPITQKATKNKDALSIVFDI
ncbi:MAG: hypothetical protein ABIN97_19370, partial [Ginsengibacter sp.]